MVEAAPTRSPRSAPRGPRARARGDQEALRGAGGASRARPASRSGSTPRLTAEIEEQHGDRDPRADPGRRPPRGRRGRRGDLGRALPAAHDGLDGGGRRAADPGRARASPCSSSGCASKRSTAPVREQFENELRALTDAEQDSKELKSAKRQLLFDRIIETVELPFPVGPATVEGERPSSRTHDEAVRQEGRRGDLQGARPQEDRGREAPPDGRGTGGDPPDRRARSASRRARTAPGSSRAARRRS